MAFVSTQSERWFTIVRSSQPRHIREISSSAKTTRTGPSHSYLFNLHGSIDFDHRIPVSPLFLRTVCSYDIQMWSLPANDQEQASRLLLASNLKRMIHYLQTSSGVGLLKRCIFIYVWVFFTCNFIYVKHSNVSLVIFVEIIIKIHSENF